MYDFFTGELTRKMPGTAVVACGGIGYALRISLATYDLLPPAGKTVTLWAHFESGGDAGIRLFGFAAEFEREIFRLLLNVNGVGPATALAIVSGAPLEDLRRSVAEGDIASLKRIKGVGPKTAQRLVLDLQETFKTLGPAAGPRRAAAADAILALVALGYPRPIAEKAVREVEGKVRKDAPAEEIVREALKKI
ncbi:MAG: Holliday junction branch migration protein RuvA [Planctomycetes bacterium]|nr:Holliday junction branch migration protein RuvA [Planctomycetota bacterium]